LRTSQAFQQRIVLFRVSLEEPSPLVCKPHEYDPFLLEELYRFDNLAWENTVACTSMR
jgi:hypothetical protein